MGPITRVATALALILSLACGQQQNSNGSILTPTINGVPQTVQVPQPAFCAPVAANLPLIGVDLTIGGPDYAVIVSAFPPYAGYILTGCGSIDLYLPIDMATGMPVGWVIFAQGSTPTTQQFNIPLGVCTFVGETATVQAFSIDYTAGRVVIPTCAAEFIGV
jgi:hypothetical protein